MHFFDRNADLQYISQVAIFLALTGFVLHVPSVAFRSRPLLRHGALSASEWCQYVPSRSRLHLFGCKVELQYDSQVTLSCLLCTPVQEVPPSPGGLSGDRDTGAHHLGNGCQQQPGKGSAAAYQGQWWLCWWTYFEHTVEMCRMPELQFPSVV